MAEVSRGRGIFGRLLAALGVAWVFWGFLGPVIGLQFGSSLVDLPILPGIVIFFIGRALNRGSRRDASTPEQDVPKEAPVPPRPEPRVRPAPVPERPVREPSPEPVAISEVILDSFEAPEHDLPDPDDIPVRKTSAEMVAEARRRYGTRP